MLWMTILKAVGTLAVVVLISEIQKRSNVMGAAIAALPLMTMLVVFNLATDPKAGTGQANLFANTTFLLFWPGITFFILLPVLQKFGLSFWWSFGVGVVLTFVVTLAAIAGLRAIGVKID
ncbi:MAG TPA: hypothetical protein PLN33_09530 [Hyphomonadaceae bacterium]|nr:hypothetical protein [Hyphomonadaceae bacterium]HPN05950.1 hypothetical protein [Hyphomonadaceae bacterium]